MRGNVLNIPLTRKQQKSEETNNYLQYVEQLYEDFEM